MGLVCTRMRASDYEALMVKGWRRCGNYYYKPDVINSCCRLNTIRCDAQAFVPNKSQKKAEKKFQRYLTGTKPADNNKKAKRQKNKLEIPTELIRILTESIRIAVQDLVEFSQDFVKVTRNLPNRTEQFGDFSVASCIIICSRNKHLNREEVLQRLVEILSKSLENSDFRILNTDKFHVNLKCFALPETISQEAMEVELEKHVYTSEIVSAEFSEESYLVYRKYQISVHKEPPNKPSRAGYEGFLCGTNLVTEPKSEKNPLGLGNFHQLHRIDGKLAAVGVLDFLPSGISAVYFFYDPEFSHLALGVIGALREIDLIKAHLTIDFKYYYMGFYIHTCQKMRYKGEYLPSQLLCPTNFVWVDIEKVLKEISHQFKKIDQCSEETVGKKDPDMDFTGVNYLEFIQANVNFELQGGVTKIDALNDKGKQYVFGLLAPTQGYFTKTMLKRLVFKLN